MIKAIIIDEQLDHCVQLQQLVETTYEGSIKIVDFCLSPIQGIYIAKKYLPDFIFLSAEMADNLVDGVPMLTYLNNSSGIIITSENQPIKNNLPGVLSAYLELYYHRQLEKIPSYLKMGESCFNLKANQIGDDAAIFLPTETGYSRIKIADIQYVSVSGELSKIFLTSNFSEITSLMGFGQLSQKLPQDVFLRIPPNVLINKYYMDRWVQKDGSLKLKSGQILIP